MRGAEISERSGLSLAASTAKSYCNLISAQQQLVLAQTTLDSFEKIFA
jgi:outer membrane protein TolC